MIFDYIRKIKNRKFKRKNNKSLIIILIIILISQLSSFAKCDLPVHCLLKDVFGYWEFRISTNFFNPSLSNEDQISCGHGVPNRVISKLDDGDLNIKEYKKLNLNLKENFDVFEENKKVGKWSFVYDQSLIINYNSAILTAPFKYYKRNGKSKVESNCSKTFLGWYIPNSNLLNLNWSCFYGQKILTLNQNFKNINSFLQIGSNEIEIKTNIKGYIDNNLSNELKKINKIPTKNSYTNNNIFFGYSFVQTCITNKKLIENNLKYEQMSKIIDKLNMLDLGWKAKVHDKYIGMSFAQVKKEMGLDKGNYNNKKDNVLDINKEKDRNFSFIQINDKISKNTNLIRINNYLDDMEKEINELVNIKEKNKKDKNINQNLSLKIKKSGDLNKKNILENKEEKIRTKNKLNFSSKNFNNLILDINSNCNFDPDSSDVNSYSETIKYINTPIEDIDITKLSKNWDWRNVGGNNYVPPVRNQGNCGSCYVFSTMTALESRLRIKTNNKDKTLFSKQYPLSCNFYSEGCDGGYPIFVAKFSKEFELIPEECFEYTETTNSCKNVCDFSNYPIKYSVNDYGYLGGVYGKTNESQLIKEIRARGPLPGNMLVHWGFQYYKSGIYSSKPLVKNSNKINLKTLFDYGVTWEKVEHSITLIGYGEENGTKYWIGMNTWGDEWGDKGFFKILRGENESQIESMGDYFDVKFENRNK
jgi:C1A family cysteine protease